MVSSKRKPNNHPIYFVDIEFGSSIFYNDLFFEEEDPNTVELPVKDEANHQAGKISMELIVRRDLDQVFG